MKNANLETLSQYGVSVWLDDLSRERLVSGGLARLIDEMSVVGVTTNPTIFQAAITGSDLYADQIRAMAETGADVNAVVRALVIDDVRAACDLLRPVADASDGVDGRVSIEVDPRLAFQGDATLERARLLWKSVDRSNLLVKIPATREGLPAIRAAIADGISVNVTLIFSTERYREVMQAYIGGLEDRLTAGGSVAGIESVASFFVSRVDTAIDAQLTASGNPQALALRGKAAVANAKLAYQAFRETFAGPRWAALQAAGARPQRPLWASTGVKNPDYSDTMYVTDLIGPSIVNTMPEATLLAFADHGKARPDSISEGVDEAARALAGLAAAGVDLREVTAQLETEGVVKFQQSWEDLLASISEALDSAVED